MVMVVSTMIDKHALSIYYKPSIVRNILPGLLHSIFKEELLLFFCKN